MKTPKKNIKTIAIIIARGGSKRIFKKNIKIFLGKPIISYSINTALKCNFFDEVMVSTDDLEIAKISRLFGAKTPFIRSAKNSSDFSTTADVIEEVLYSYKEQNIIPKYVCCIYPTAPLLSNSLLKKAYEILINKKAEAVIPVAKFSYPIQRSLIIENEKLKMFWPENIDKRSQDLFDFYHDAGQFYFLNTKSFLENPTNPLNTKSTYPLLIPSILVQDIDNEEDWKIAEFKYKYLKETNQLI